MNDEVVGGVKITDERTNICDCRVVFATEKPFGSCNSKSLLYFLVRKSGKLTKFEGKFPIE